MSLFREAYIKFFEAYYLFMIKSHFFGDWWFLMWFLVGTREPPPYCNKIPTKSPFCIVVVLVWKSWDWQTPPSVGTKSQINPKIRFEGSPKTEIEKKCIPLFSTFDVEAPFQRYMPQNEMAQKWHFDIWGDLPVTKIEKKMQPAFFNFWRRGTVSEISA